MYAPLFKALAEDGDCKKSLSCTKPVGAVAVNCRKVWIGRDLMQASCSADDPDMVELHVEFANRSL